MTFSETINAELKKAMLEKNKLRLQTLRSLRALILEFEKSGDDKQLTDADAQTMLLSAAKKRKDAITQYLDAGREELAEKEQQELAIIQEFLPEQLSEEEVKTIVQSIITEVGAKEPKDMGKVMGAAMKKLRGKADGTLVQTIAKQLLAS